ncbi:MAG: glycosyltransferase family 9 protein [Actinomycetes bacterium]
MLVLRALGLGDALTGVAPLRGVRRRWPDRRLVLAAPDQLGRLLQRLGVVDDVLPTAGLEPLPHKALRDHGLAGGHVAVNLHGRGPESHRLLQATGPRQLVAFSCEGVGHVDGPVWVQDEHEVDRWCRLLTGVGGDCGPTDLLLPTVETAAPRDYEDVIVVHPGASSGSRRWPASSWRQVAGELASSGLRVVVTGNAVERDLCAEVARAHPDVEDLSGSLELEQLCGLVAHARLLLSGDTGVAHLATAWSTPSVTLFGPVPPTWWGAAVERHLHIALWTGGSVATDDEPYTGDPHGDEVDPALARIPVDEVLSAAEGLLRQPSCVGGAGAV